MQHLKNLFKGKISRCFPSKSLFFQHLHIWRILILEFICPSIAEKIAGTDAVVLKTYLTVDTLYVEMSSGPPFYTKTLHYPLAQGSDKLDLVFHH
jgi:hypothetical protein